MFSSQVHLAAKLAQTRIAKRPAVGKQVVRRELKMKLIKNFLARSITFATFSEN